jgi:hypothetical protein
MLRNVKNLNKVRLNGRKDRRITWLPIPYQ